MTFTIVARDPRTNTVGLCQGTSAMGVASRCTHVRSGVAAIGSQSHSDWRIGRRALDLAESGLDPALIIEALRTTDAYFDYRQVGIVTADGRTAVHTGSSCGPYAADRTGDGFIVMGNLMVGPKVLDAMFASFEGSGDQDFPERLMRALEAALDAGGEGVAHLSSTIVVAGPESPRPLLDLRVDVAPLGGDSIKELRRIFDEFAPLIDYYADYWLDHPDVTPDAWIEMGSPTSR